MGCQFELSGDFFRELSKPAASHKGEITLSLDQDSIIIYEPTKVNYSVNSFGLKYNAIEIEYLKTKVTNDFESSGSFMLTPDFSVNGWIDLKATFYLSSGSGSIAEKLKAENYVGTKTWKVKFFNLNAFDFKFQYHVNKDGILELFWVKPSCISSVEGKVTRYGNEVLQSKISGDTLFYADDSYCGDMQMYNLSITVKNQAYKGFSLSPNYPYPELKFKSLGLDSCLISWTPSPIKRYYKLNELYAGFGNSFKYKCTPGDLKAYDLYIYPPNYKPGQFSTYNVWTFYQNGGIKADYRFTYSYLKDRFVLSMGKDYPNITVSDNNIPAYDNPANGGKPEYQLYGNNQGTQYVGLGYGVLYVFDKDLNKTKEITLGVPGQFWFYIMQLTDNGCFAYYDNFKEYVVNNVGSDPSWQQFRFKPNNEDYQMGFMTQISVMGDHFYWLGKNYFYIYDISDHKNAKIVYSAPSSKVGSILANPLNNDELIVGQDSKIEVYSSPDFKLKKQISLPGVGKIYIENVDTYDNYLLASSTNYSHIINLENMKEVLRFGSGLGGVMYRKQLFVNSYKIDLTPYLK